MSNILYKVYSYLPVGLQNAAISIFGYLWQKRRFGGVFKENLLFFKSHEDFNSVQWKNHVNRELVKLLLYAFDNVPYYTELYIENGFKRTDLEGVNIDNLYKLPFLEKDALRQFGETKLMANSFDKDGKYFASSGSTGTPTKIYFSKKTHQLWSAAFEVRIRNWAGINYKTPRGMIGGRRVLPKASDGPPFYRYNIVEKQVYYSAYHISPKTVIDYLDGMKKHEIVYMNGYAVSNYLLAYYIKKEGLKAPKLKAVITSSEKLTFEMRKVIEEVYQCKAYDSWSGVEACALISECEYGSLHVSEDVGFIEILDENGNEVAEGESGEVVCTGFLNYDQPLIRYRIGDRMTKGFGNCKCGRQMPIIKEIEGRLEDLITGPDGRQMVRFHGVFVGISSIERAQVIQHSIDHIVIMIQNEILLTNDEIEIIKSRVRSQLGNLKVVVQQFAKIEQTSNGKYKAVISHINK
jgi:phenylacetate-CoA ligase